MFKNTNARPAKTHSMSGEGNVAPYANMPAKNSGNHSYGLGTTHKSTFGQGVKPVAAQAGNSQSKTGGKANMPANNITDKKVSLGHTKHGVGQVPGYLKGTNSSSYN